jgi:heme exporter protein A
MPVTSSSSTVSLDVRALHLWRGDRHLLRGVNFTVAAGELLQVVGPNGVGKTSLLRCVASLLPAESGEISWCGEGIDRCRDEYHGALAYLAHSNALKSDLTALENLHYGVQLRREVSAQNLLDILHRLGIQACAHLPARVLSAGQKRRLAIARVIASDAPLWVLDEPITNLDVSGISLFEGCMAEHLRSGGLILTAAHQLLLKGEAGVRTLELH